MNFVKIYCSLINKGWFTCTWYFYFSKILDFFLDYFCTQMSIYGQNLKKSFKVKVVYNKWVLYCRVETKCDNKKYKGIKKNDKWMKC